MWKDSNSKLEFNEVCIPELSTINSFSDTDNHKIKRKESFIYEVNTISLYDLLEKYNAPNQIDYLSIDTEGSEFDILNSFDFNGKYKILVITVEHNFTPKRNEIFELLSRYGYKRVYEEVSMFDDWYIKV